MTFASQAARVIANARRYREEQHARSDLEALVNTAPIGVAVFDARSGDLESVNREAQRIVSTLQEPGQHAADLLQVMSVRRADGTEFSLKEFTVAEALTPAETVRAEEIVMHVPDGRSVTALMNATPIHSAEGDLVSFVVTIQDLTPLEELDRLRTEFLAMVSHELQIPLTSIKGSASMLLNDPGSLDPAEMRQFFRIIDDQAEHMRSLMRDLLDMARIETGTLSVFPEPAEVTRLVDEAKSHFLNAGGRNELQIELAPDLPLVMADGRRIVQVIGNLLSNAARYSSELSPIGLVAGRDGVHVAISVVDEGAGLAPEHVPQLFGKYSRLDNQERRSSLAGSGLGLAICRGIVEAHGGRIHAESPGPGMGSRFTFTLPSAGDAPAVIAPSAFGPRQAHPERVRILAVDDDPQALRYVREVLTRAGHAPIVASDAESALRLVKEEEPHLVLLDLMLPGTDGIKLMRSILDIADVPVIFVSVYGQDDYVVRAFDMGASDYIVKPFSPSELGARIRAALRKRRPAELPEPDEPYVLGDLALNFMERRVTLAGRPVELTATEYRLLVELAANSGRVVTNDQLLERIWGAGHSAGTEPVRNIVSRLRRKLGDSAGGPKYIFHRVPRRLPHRAAAGLAGEDRTRRPHMPRAVPAWLDYSQAGQCRSQFVAMFSQCESRDELEPLRGMGGRIVGFCPAGTITAGRWPSVLLAVIENVIHNASRPQPGHMIHPKGFLGAPPPRPLSGALLAAHRALSEPHSRPQMRHHLLAGRTDCGTDARDQRAPRALRCRAVTVDKGAAGNLRLATRSRLNQDRVARRRRLPSSW